MKNPRNLIPLVSIEELKASAFDSDDYEDDDDPESWRFYNDVVDSAQIAWLEKHPEHDRTNVLGRLESGELKKGV